MDRKTEALMHIAKGLTIDDAAREMRVSRSCVEKHLASIKEKLSARSLYNAVYIAAKRGVLAVALTITIIGAQDAARRNCRVRDFSPDAYTLSNEIR